ncbi:MULTISPECIES: hypothetical protein [unclassified Saccharopolyspora]|uniref:hypothetical protein n=1 Tax=unclassified Saccharopolyspora TaxID=2646250 RepID=UPI001CD6B979|nr:MULTISPECIES: hypothetical protein [unclassified Saccharopolyspora]MCA1189687.1 hypothetical protein [Saccharopolyspora sp. 6T]MCA1193079.1 hypothetical protein [Saccharopolyspora sp. 6V]MCA1229174.1 hypothetical protein [Saccharopolyspora sp. 6M]MCA1279087.1 hypothetical protein [Saccharopolyspora sp. 7B]
MSDPLDAETPSADEVGPDPADPQDPAELQSAGDLDEDELGVDPLEEGVEPPEHWSRDVVDRPTPREQREGETIDERLAEERPDPDDEVGKPLAETRLHELDDTVDEQAAEEVADGVSGEQVAEQAERSTGTGAVVEGEEVEDTGLSAVTNEGSAAPARNASPEENAERVQDGGA